MRAATFLALLVLAPFTDAGGQEPPLQIGQPVRLKAPQSDLEETKATLIAARHDTLVIRWRRAQLIDGRMVRDSTTSAVPIVHITKFEVGRRRSNWKNGLMWGSALGGGMGLLLMAATDPEEDYIWLGCTGASCVVSGIFGGALWGLAIGALIKTNKWEEIPLDRLRVSVAPVRNGFGIGARIAF